MAHWVQQRTSQHLRWIEIRYARSNKNVPLFFCTAKNRFDAAELAGRGILKRHGIDFCFAALGTEMTNLDPSVLISSSHLCFAPKFFSV